jgi:cytochrome c biogenesis factor
MLSLQQQELIFVGAIALVVALLAAAIAAITNRKWPDSTPAQVMMLTGFVLVLVVIGLRAIWTFGLSKSRCLEGSACDAGAMAAMSAVAFGAFGIVVSGLVGTPVAYFTVRLLRRG